MTFQSAEDDEALARLLQFEEQSGTSSARSPQTATGTPSSMIPNEQMTDQEKRDMEMARRMAQMELYSGNGGNTNSRSNDTARTASRHQREAPPFSSDISSPRPYGRSRHDPRSEPTAQTHTANSSSSPRHPLDRARLIQQQALQHIQMQQQRQQRPPSNSAAAQNDFELAQRIHQEEATTNNNKGATEDERLARLMAATGRSLRDLTEDELTDMFASSLKQPSNRHRRTASAIESGGGGGQQQNRRNSNSTPTSPTRSRAKLRDTATHAASAPTSPHPTQHPTDSAAGVASSSIFPESRSEQTAKPPPASSSSSGGVEKSPRRNMRWFRVGGNNNNNNSNNGSSAAGLKAPPSAISGVPGGIPAAPALDIPSAIPPPPRPPTSGKSSVCVKCGLSDGTFLRAKDRLYHPECFRCAACMQKIDTHNPFGFRKMRNPETGKEEQVPFHPDCLKYAKSPEDTCIVCKQMMPRGMDGMICYVKHPFFNTERMCPKHSDPSDSACARRCTSCHRFEPLHEPFADLSDAGRCVCFACCRSVIMDGSDVLPLWNQVISFFEDKMKLPIWEEMRQIPVLVVGYDALNEQLSRSDSYHAGCTQIMTRGLCLTEHEHDHTRHLFKMPSMRFNKSSSSFEALDKKSEGFTYYDLDANSSGKKKAKVAAIMCLSGLPRDLTASVLAHEAMHAWLKLHPDYDFFRNPLPLQVEEGLAQLVAMLFLNEGLDPPTEMTSGDTAPSDERLRQYFRFCIESDDSDIYGRGYKSAAKAYAEVGIQALMRHILLYGGFPSL